MNRLSFLLPFLEVFGLSASQENLELFVLNKYFISSNEDGKHELLNISSKIDLNKILYKENYHSLAVVKYQVT